MPRCAHPKSFRLAKLEYRMSWIYDSVLVKHKLCMLLYSVYYCVVYAVCTSSGKVEDAWKSNNPKHLSIETPTEMSFSFFFSLFSFKAILLFCMRISFMQIHRVKKSEWLLCALKLKRDFQSRMENDAAIWLVNRLFVSVHAHCTCDCCKRIVGALEWVGV